MTADCRRWSSRAIPSVSEHAVCQACLSPKPRVLDIVPAEFHVLCGKGLTACLRSLQCNKFGDLFREVAQSMQAAYRHDTFDSSVIEVLPTLVLPSRNEMAAH
jgi:hypothetical protein